MKKSKFKFLGFSANKAFSKLVLAFCFAFVFVGLGEMNAQQTLDSGLEIYPAGTFEQESSFLLLNDEMNNMTKGQTVSIEYRYYWLVAVDIKRNSIPVEEALVQNLQKVRDEFNSSEAAIQTLYQETVDKL